MLSVAAVVRAFDVVATSAMPRLASLARRPCRSVLEPPSPRSLFTHACLVSCAAGQSALLVLFVIMLALTLASSTPAPFPRTLTVRDLCDQPSSSPRAMSSRSPSACRLSFTFPLELCLQMCIHKLPKLIALCVLAVRVLNFGVKHVCFVGTLTFASFYDIMDSFRLLSKLWRTPPVPTWSSPKPCCPVSAGPQETARTTRLVLTSSIPRGGCPRSGAYRLHSSTSRSARPGARHHFSRTCATRPIASWPPQPSLSTRWTTCLQSHQMHC